MLSRIKLRKINRLGRLAIAGVLGAAIAFAAVQLTWPGTPAPVEAIGIQGPTGPTVAEPLAAPAKQTTMAAAVSALGVSVPLPKTSAVKPTDVGAVWEGSWSSGTSTTMAVTFPSQGFIISYHRPSGWPADPTKAWQELAATLKSAHVIELNGTTPAIAIAQNSDLTGTSFGNVAFVVNGTEVWVMGHTDESTLVAMAESIVAQWPAKSDPGPVGPTGPRTPSGASTH